MNRYTSKSRIYQRQRARRAAKRKKRKRLLTKIAFIGLIVCLGCFGCNCAKQVSNKINEIRYPVSYSSYITRYAKENKLDPYLVIAVIKQESNFIADAKSAYAGGLMQLTEVTADEYAKKMGLVNYDYMNPETNIKIGCYVLASLIDRYESVDTALAAYNAGAGNVDSWLRNPDYSDDGKTLKSIPFSETRHYVKRVNEHMKEYKNQINMQ